MLSLVCHGEVCDGCGGVSRAVLPWQITAEIQGVIRMFWRCDKPKCARAVAGTAFSSCWSFTLSDNCNHCCTLGSLQRIYVPLQFQRGAQHLCAPSPLPPSHQLPHQKWCLSCCHCGDHHCALRGLAEEHACLSWQDRDPGQTLALPRERGMVGHHLNAGVEDPSFPHILPIPLQFPPWSLDFQLLPLFTASKSPLCFLKKISPFPILTLHPLGWQQAPPVAITTSTSLAKSARPHHTSLPASKSPPYVWTHSVPQVFTICLQGGYSVLGVAGPLHPPMCPLSPLCTLCSPPGRPIRMMWTTFTVPHTLRAKTPLFWPIKPMQIKLWIHEHGRIAWNTVKKMCPGLYYGLVWKLEGMSSVKVQGKKRKIIKQSHWVSLPCGLSLKSSPWSVCWCWVKPLCYCKLDVGCCRQSLMFWQRVWKPALPSLSSWGPC